MSMPPNSTPLSNTRSISSLTFVMLTHPVTLFDNTAACRGTIICVALEEDEQDTAALIVIETKMVRSSKRWKAIIIHGICAVKLYFAVVI